MSGVLLCVAGPPFSSQIFRGVAARLAPRPVELVELAVAAGDGLEAALAQLQAQVEAHEAVAVLGHGLAVPLVLRLEGVQRIVTNGPTRQLDPVTQALAALPRRALVELMRPAPFQAWLRSSAGLRRAVANPYVMDRDTVALLTDPVLGERAARAGAARWVTELSRWLPTPPARLDGVLALWGDADALYPVDAVSEAIDEATGSALVRIEGGRHLHPEERPWALADVLETALAAREL